MRLKSIFGLAAVSTVMFCADIYCAAVVLKNGETIEGEVLEKTDKYIKIEHNGFEFTYYLDEIANVDESESAAEPNPLGPAPEAGRPNGADTFEPAFMPVKPRPSLEKPALDLEQLKIEPWFENGLALILQGKEKEAITELRKGAAYYESDDDYASLLAVVLDINAGRLDKNKGIELIRGLSARREKKYDEAIVRLAKIAPELPEYGQSYFQLAKVWEAKGDDKQAGEYYQKAIERNERFGAAYYNLGQIYVREGKSRDAFGIYNKALRAGANAAVIFFGMAEYYVMSGQSQHALLYYERALEYDRYNPWFYFGLSQYYGALGDDASSRKNLQNAEKLFKIKNDTAGLEKINKSR